MPFLRGPRVAPLTQAAMRTAAQLVVVEGPPEVGQHGALQAAYAVGGDLHWEAGELGKLHGEIGTWPLGRDLDEIFAIFAHVELNGFREGRRETQPPGLSVA